MPRITVSLGEESGRNATGATWRYAVGYVPGEENGGLIFERGDPSPARLADYDDSGWEEITDLPQRNSGGFTFCWYRTRITIPETVDGNPTTGMRVQFETCVDDYGEIWIDGQCNRDRGTVQGFNTPQRVLVSQSVTPGDQHTIAVLAINGPLAEPFGTVFVRYANLGFEW
ncbi:MAG: hypothetical protein OXI91_05540 [Chloroflexota bacterium]|nr:hypothetical protein [Chloroflexota bacterium]